jgi:glycosyltransferase involved in cell wall biosynthesis
VKLVAATRVLNESDIIEAFVRHTASFVDHHLFIDNGSVDGTLDILQNLQREGFGLSVFQSRACSFVESQALTLMYRHAAVAHRADWVVLLDADEFIDDRALGRMLRDHMSAVPDVCCAMKIRLRDYHLTPDDPQDPIVPCRMLHCTPVSENSKVVLRGSLIERGLVVQPGSHSARFGDGTECPSDDEAGLTYAHYPTRSAYQWLSKSVIGWAKVVAAGPTMLSSGHAVHYRDPFEFLRTDPGSILRNRSLMEPQNRSDLRNDPLDYRGDALKYTPPVDYPMRSTQVIMQYLYELAVQHGEMLDLVTKLGDVVRRNEAEVTRVI